jgi:hypothetical protein
LKYIKLLFIIYFLGVEHKVGTERNYYSKRIYKGLSDTEQAVQFLQHDNRHLSRIIKKNSNSK